MKITDLRVIVTCSVGQTYTLVKIMVDAGVYGVGKSTKNGRELAVAALLEQHLALMLIGRDPGAIEDIWKFLYKGAYWRGGPVQNSALDRLSPIEAARLAKDLEPYHLIVPGRPDRPRARRQHHTAGHWRDHQPNDRRADDRLHALLAHAHRRHYRGQEAGGDR